MGNLYCGFSQEFPRVMYVNSIEGSNLRNEPSLNGNKIGALLHGERILVYEWSNSVTINGISNFWYRTKRSGTNLSGWVFGGYLSEDFPIDADVILGMWNTDQGERMYWYFRPNYKFNSGVKETDRGIYGDWNRQFNYFLYN